MDNSELSMATERQTNYTIMVYCATCKDSLKRYTEKVEDTINVIVLPCSTCSNSAHKEGFEFGKKWDSRSGPFGGF